MREFGLIYQCGLRKFTGGYDDDYIIHRYTEFDDINGKPVYRGDIVSTIVNYSDTKHLSKSKTFKMNTYILLGIIVLFAYSLGDVFSKKFGVSPNWKLILGASLSYLTTSFIWLYYISKGMDVGRGSILFGIASVISGLFVGCVIYHEPLTLTDWVGVFFGIASIIILNLK